jgi:serine/threonine protein kinase
VGTHHSSSATKGAATSGVGTPHYMAPEIIDVFPAYSPASDAFAFGVVCWETVAMKLPYAECVDMHLLKKSIRKKGLRPAFPDDFPPALRALIERAWHTDPARRPSVVFIMGLGMQVTRHASRVSHDTSDCDICHMTHALSSLRGPTPLYNASSTAASASFAWTTAISA